MSKTYTIPESWTIRGRYFGFPECCIQEFLPRIDMSTEDMLKEEPRKLDGTGYMPCSVCNEKPEAELIKVINSNRRSPQAFPIEEIDEKHMSSILKDLV